MKNNRNLFKEAIAEAKAVKEVSIANAKAALEEALTPRLKTMFEQKLAEMDAKETHTEDVDEEETDEVFDLEELLAELDSSDEEEEEEAPEEDDSEMDSEISSEEDVEIDFDNMSEEDLRTFIEEVVDEMIEANELDVDSEEGDAEEEEVDIEDLDGEDELEIEEGTDKSTSEMKDHEEEVINDSAHQSKKDKYMNEKLKREGKENKEHLTKLEADLTEAVTAVKDLRTELNEVNLLNSKLLYLNKIFKSTNLKESQKVNTIAAFDKAVTVKEVKLVYETLQENFIKVSPKETTKKLVRESKNFASAAIIGASPKQPVMEVDPMITRMKKLAGLI